MAVVEDVWSRVSRLSAFKDGKRVQDKMKNFLRSFIYDYIDLDLKEFKLGARKLIFQIRLRTSLPFWNRIKETTLCS